MHWLALQWPDTGAGAAPKARGVGEPALSPLPAPASAASASASPAAAPAPASASASASPDAAPPEPPSTEALGWWALQFTPHAAWVDEALLLEVSACERFWGGRRGLLAEIRKRNPSPAGVLCGQGATSLIALGRLRLFVQGKRPAADMPAALPLHTLSAAQPHLFILERMGCRTWGDVAALPRAGVSRRFGTPLRQALDRAWGLYPDGYRWLALPESFDRKVELRALAHYAAELMWAAAGLLADMQIWLRGRQRGVLAVELQWTLDLRRVDGIDLPPHESLVVRTAEPVQDMAHLKRLLGERLGRTRMSAPASWLRLRSLETAPLAGASASFLPDDSRKGDRLHELIERLSERLGADSVVTPVAQADHRPEAMQRWEPAQGRIGALVAAYGAPAVPPGTGGPAATGLPRRQKPMAGEAGYVAPDDDGGSAEDAPAGRLSVDGVPEAEAREERRAAQAGAGDTFRKRSGRGKGDPAGHARSGGTGDGARHESSGTNPAGAAIGSPPRSASKPARPAVLQPDTLYPPWLLPCPVRLELQDDGPCYRGRLRMLAGPQRMETGWWTAPAAAAPAGQPAPAVRDYYIAESPSAGLVWVFCERPHGVAASAAASASAASAEGGAAAVAAPAAWFLHGLYA